MSTNILITGAAGYIGGSLIADFLESKTRIIKDQKLFAAVRSQEQADALSGLGVGVLQLDLTNKEDVAASILQHEISLVIHTASSLDSSMALNFIAALGQLKKRSGKETYFIQTSGLSAFYEKTGWAPEVNTDDGPLYETEKRLADSFPIRMTDALVIENAKAEGVTSFIVVPSLVYGKGRGKWNQLSVILPAIVKGSIADKKVRRFENDSRVSAVHISDMTALYAKIIEKILLKETIPSNEEGYYFALAHPLQMHALSSHLATALKARGLIQDSEVGIWANDEEVSKSLEFPMPFIQILFNAGENLTIKKPYGIGWKPEWPTERFLENIDDEIDAVIELGRPKSSLLESLRSVK